MNDLSENKWSVQEYVKWSNFGNEKWKFSIVFPKLVLTQRTPAHFNLNFNLGFNLTLIGIKFLFWFEFKFPTEFKFLLQSQFHFESDWILISISISFLIQLTLNFNLNFILNPIEIQSQKIQPQFWIRTSILVSVWVSIIKLKSESQSQF